MFRVIRYASLGALASAMLLAIAVPSAHAAKSASCVSKGAGEITHDGTDGSECTADGVGSTSKATAKAKDDNSTAEADAEGGGKANSNSNGASDADSFALDKCKGKATATDHSTAEGGCTAAGGAGTAKASKDSDAFAEADAACKATATAKNNLSEANAFCSNSGSVVTATATNGGEADGSDTSPPVCIPDGGTAIVRSPMGNCGP